MKAVIGSIKISAVSPKFSCTAVAHQCIMLPRQIYTAAKSTDLQTCYRLSGNKESWGTNYSVLLYITNSNSIFTFNSSSFIACPSLADSHSFWKVKILIFNITSHTADVISEVRKEPASASQLRAAIGINHDSEFHESIWKDRRVEEGGRRGFQPRSKPGLPKPTGSTSWPEMDFLRHLGWNCSFSVVSVQLKS